MADLKKFLDQSGVSTLWTRVAEEITAEMARAKVAEEAAAAAAKKAQDEVDALETYVGVIPNGENGSPIAASVIAYIDQKTEGIVSDAALDALQVAVNSHTDAITLLNGDAETAGSVTNTATAVAAAKVAEIVANANADFDTLKEIADWILNDTTGAVGMVNDIQALQNQMVDIDTTVVAEIAAEIEAALKIEGVDKYALASDLTTLASRVKALEDAGFQNAEQVGSAIDTKITALKLAESYDAKGAAETAETNAKKYTDDEMAKIQTLSESEILAAIAAASNET